MRDQRYFRALARVAAGTLTALSVFGFGAGAVRGQTAQTAAPGIAASGTTAAAAQTQGGVRRLSINEAVAMALEQNIDLQVDRIDPQIQDLNISVVRRNWTPAFFSSFITDSQTNPSTDAFGGGTDADATTNENLRSVVGVQQQLPFGGGNYTLNWNSGRLTTNSLIATFDPRLSSSMAFNYTQPLLRNFKIDNTRQQVLISRKNREISDVQLQQSISATTRSVKNAYWDLVFANNNLAVQRQSLELAQRSYRDNRARVEIGTMAPLDIVQAEAEVAQREEGVILAEAAIQRAEDTLRALISNPADQADFWNIRLEPTDPPTFEAVSINVDAAVRNALANRTDLATVRKQIEASDINVRFYRNQSMPDVNALVNYSAIGLAGTSFDLDRVTFERSNLVRRGFGGALGDVFASDYPSWSLQLQVNYPIGASTAEANLARVRLQTSQQQKNLQASELQVTTQIRNLARNVTTNAKRVESTRASRALAEKRLEAEEKKFQAGMTSSFLVIQAQRDLSQARNSELQAIIDYLKSVVDYETAQQSPLTSGGGGTVQTGQQQQQQQ
jgi:outer membrane protein